VAAVAGGYLLGSIPVAVLAGRARGFDPRQVGDHNPGFWNMKDQLGWAGAVPVLAGDTLKGTAAGLLGVSYLLGKRVRNRVKDMPYESGIVPTGDARHRFSVKFYLVAMLFILFDIEAIFLYPWAVVYRELKMFAFVEMLVFVVLILAGFFYIWKKGALDWSPDSTANRKR